MQNTKPRHAHSAYSDPIEQELLKKYIHWARENVKPRVTEVDSEKIAQFYRDVRAEAYRSGGAPMTVRHVDAMVRLAEANAKLELRAYVTQADVDNAIGLMLESFIQSQKHQVAEELRVKFRKYIKKATSEADLAHSMIHRLFHDREQQERLRNPGVAQESMEVGIEMSVVRREIERL